MICAWMFPGQGSQAPGMARRFLAEYPAARKILAEASRLSGIDLEPLRARGPATELAHPQVAEPLLAALQIGYAIEYLKKRPGPDYIAGYSAGEVAAFYAAGVLDCESALSAAVIRGETLARYTSFATRMIAVARISISRLEQILNAKDATIEIAAVNAPDHLTLVGPRDAVAEFAAELGSLGAMISDVQVAGPWHSKSLDAAVDAIQHRFQALNFQTPHTPIYLSATGRSEQSPHVLRQQLAAQVALPVLWEPIMRQWQDIKVGNVIEMGPGRVLLGFLRRCWPDYENYEVTCVETASGGIQPFQRLTTSLSTRRV